MIEILNKLLIQYSSKKNSGKVKTSSSSFSI